MSRLQEKRSAETKDALLHATLNNLYLEGYFNTTTHKIAAAAGVSRGARQHHFSTKSELVIAALDLILEERLSESKVAIAKLPKDKLQKVDRLVDAIWPMFSSPAFYAWLELVVASRSDATLRRAISSASERFSATIDELWKSVFFEDIGYTYRDLRRLINGYLESTAVEDILRGDRRGDSRQDLELIKRVARQFVMQAPAGLNRSRPRPQI
jgi:AcrR family transcriptional regulator